MLDLLRVRVSLEDLTRGAFQNGWTPLIEAARIGDLDAVKALVGAGASLDAANVMGWTALIEACRNNHILVVRFLLDAGSDVAHRDKVGAGLGATFVCLSVLLLMRTSAQFGCHALDHTASSRQELRQMLMAHAQKVGASLPAETALPSGTFSCFFPSS